LISTEPPQQVSLFDVPSSHCNPEEIDPFKLHLQSMAFYRMPDNHGQAALYFVIDSAAEILLFFDFGEKALIFLSCLPQCATLKGLTAYQGSAIAPPNFRISAKNLPCAPFSGNVARYTAVSAPSSAVNGALSPPISVCIQPGE